jgi:S1-C subfamily serine protease
VDDSPAQRAGLRAEDLIVEVDGSAVTGVGDLQRLMVADRIGAAVAVTLLRGGRTLTLELVPAELPTA